MSEIVEQAESALAAFDEYWGDGCPVEAAYGYPYEIIRGLLVEIRAAGVVAEEPEWKTERIEQARIHYRYGVNSGTLTTLNTTAAIADAIEREERRAMGPIGAGKIETRTKITRTSPWVPVNQEQETE